MHESYRIEAYRDSEWKLIEIPKHSRYWIVWRDNWMKFCIKQDHRLDDLMVSSGHKSNESMREALWDHMMQSTAKLASVFLMFPLQIPWGIFLPVFLSPPPLSDSRRTHAPLESLLLKRFDSWLHSVQC